MEQSQNKPSTGYFITIGIRNNDVKEKANAAIEGFKTREIVRLMKIGDSIAKIRV